MMGLMKLLVVRKNVGFDTGNSLILHSKSKEIGH